ncbi:hypothetical protein B0A48_04445 [Cryoendolithus antarcticus]|uniref:F-box domain-containing protein n=1 Tax=Cryoendolithus antarcticus TaxID=1507870 RepID=A0A1V8TFD4_9PEZI|nr:hypothetical protein B0A48_04445 [Cryoendolithus antarcticus]
MPPATLLALPEELRLLIYGQLFTPLPATATIPLSPPAYAVLRTCRQIYVEALPLYRARYGNYYSTSHFTLILDDIIPKSEAEARILSISEQEFDKITNLTITARPPGSKGPDYAEDWTYTLIHPHGGWRMERPAACRYHNMSWPMEGEEVLPNGRLVTHQRYRPQYNEAEAEAMKVAWPRRKGVWGVIFEKRGVLRCCSKLARRSGGLRTHVLELVMTGMVECGVDVKRSEQVMSLLSA